MFYSIASFYIVMKAAYLYSLVRILVKFDVMQRYFVFLAVVYTGGIAFLSYALLYSWQEAFNLRNWEIWLAETFGLATLYFWLLGRFDVGIIFVILLGLGLGLVWF